MLVKRVKKPGFSKNLLQVEALARLFSFPALTWERGCLRLCLRIIETGASYKNGFLDNRISL